MEITQELIKKYFDYKDGFLFWKIKPSRKVSIGDKAGYFNKYNRIGFCGKKYTSHRLIFLYHHALLPLEVDHINGDKSNNNIWNLRAASRSQNQANRKSAKNSTSPYLGVCLTKKGKYLA